jgi:thymidylate synthase (FAD)
MFEDSYIPDARLIEYDHREALARIYAARSVCYGKLDGIDPENNFRKLTSAGFCPNGTFSKMSSAIRQLVKDNHWSPIEQAPSAMVSIICTRACSHQIVRHRIISPNQISQRYCASDRIGLRHEIVIPDNLPDEVRGKFLEAKYSAIDAYVSAIEAGIKPQTARYVLPNGMLTKLLITANLREWHHMIELRTSRHADDEIRILFKSIQRQFRKILPEIFGDEEQSI